MNQIDRFVAATTLLKLWTTSGEVMPTKEDESKHHFDVENPPRLGVDKSHSLLNHRSLELRPSIGHQRGIAPQPPQGKKQSERKANAQKSNWNQSILRTDPRGHHEQGPAHGKSQWNELDWDQKLQE